MSLGKSFLKEMRTKPLEIASGVMQLSLSLVLLVAEVASRLWILQWGRACVSYGKAGEFCVCVCRKQSETCDHKGLKTRKA